MAAPWTTALVTGASSGIGAAIARLLAARGVDLVLSARDTARLRELADELRSEHGVAVQVLTADLSTKAGLRKVASRLVDEERAPVDLLVNNAGFGSNGPFWELDVDTELDEVSVNVVAVVRLTHAALGGMVARGHGTVLNVSSIAGEQPVPGNATYGATKSFVTTFSQAVHGDAKAAGVDVTVVLPGWTRTEFQERSGMERERLPELVWMDADDVAEQALAGAEAGKAVVVPGLGNRLATVAADVVPRGVKRWAVARLAARM